jgi:FtsZ-binding cell division protein ZapB
MVTLTLDDTDYETEDFTEEQNRLVQEITYGTNVKNQLDFQSNSLRIFNDQLVERLRSSLETKTESE